MSCPSFLLDGPLTSSPACSHAFLDRLAHSDLGSPVVQLFVTEYSVLRRGARALDAALPDAHEQFRQFMKAFGLIGPGWVEQAMPATRDAIEKLQALTRDPDRRDGALWAIERSGLLWARICARRGWGRRFWEERCGVDPIVPDPVAERELDPMWEAGRDAALLQLGAWLESLELAVTEGRVA